ncbi:hypothetical protein Tco_0985603 [Tanacetum coccineum]
MVFHNEDGNPARANIKQALGYLKDGDGDGNSQHLRYQVSKASANYDVMYILHKCAQDGGSSQDDEDYVLAAMISRKLKITVKDKPTRQNQITPHLTQPQKMTRHTGDPMNIDWLMGHGQESRAVMKLKEAQDGFNG